MRKTSSEKLTGNDQFEGYVVDLTREISRVLGFNYTFRLVPDGHYGSLNRLTNEWDGMISELLEQVSTILDIGTQHVVVGLLPIDYLLNYTKFFDAEI